MAQRKARPMNLVLDLAKKKAREARFFHGHLVKVDQPTTHNEPDAFDFFLSAFLSAGESVGFLLHARRVYQDWYDGLAGFEKVVVDLMASERGEAVHNTGTTQRPGFDLIPMRKLPVARARYMVFAPGDVQEDGIIVTRHYYRIDGIDHLATDVGAQYLQSLQRLIVAAEKALDEANGGTGRT